MTNLLEKLLKNNEISPLSYFFARFIARKANCSEDDLLTLSAALVSETNQEHGDVCVDLNKYNGKPLFNSDSIDLKSIQKGLDAAAWISDINDKHCIGGPGTAAPLIIDENRLYLSKYWNYENNLLNEVTLRSKLVGSLDKKALKDNLEKLFSDEKNEDEVDWQKVAAGLAVSRNFAVISGGPGTGKTTTVIKVLALLLMQNPDMHIRLVAPTGKAAKRMAESIQDKIEDINVDDAIRHKIPTQACTLHRLLGYSSRGFRHNKKNPLVADCIVIDEASMINLSLMSKLLDALTDNTRVILLGDRDQLASVEAGNVLGDITGHGQAISYSSEQIAFLEEITGESLKTVLSTNDAPPISDSVAILYKSYRFKDDSGIGKLARQVNAGNGSEALQLLKEGDEHIKWIETVNDSLSQDVIDWAMDEYSIYLNCDNHVDALEALEKVRILCALRQGPFGVNEVNRQIALKFQKKKLLEVGDDIHGKPILITSNDYEVGLFNGDIGLLWRDEDGMLRAYFKGHVNGFSLGNLPEYEAAWALTIHKSQGSEFDNVLLILPNDESNPIVTRELIYTGITRAKEMVVVHGDSKTLISGCKKSVSRSSGLAQRLGWMTSIDSS